MTAPQLIVIVLWLAFWAYWLLSARRSKRGMRSWRGMPLRALLGIAVVALSTLVDTGGLEVHGIVPQVLGLVVVACGLAFAVWARIHIGRNWGMPMTIKEEPELVTSGPYRLVRHPIYTGILTAVLGTALSINLLALGVAAALTVFFLYSATVEEKNLRATFPHTYPAYRARTKMLIPFVI